MSVCALVLAVAFLPGCALSISISKAARTAAGSVSDSLQSSSDRLRGSGDDSARLEREYRDDVRVAVRDLVEEGATRNGLLRELSRIAELHGISHWEAKPGTLIAIGGGVCEAGAAEADLDALLRELGRDAAEERALAHEGCRAAVL